MRALARVFVCVCVCKCKKIGGKLHMGVRAYLFINLCLRVFRFANRISFFAFDVEQSGILQKHYFALSSIQFNAPELVFDHGFTFNYACRAIVESGILIADISVSPSELVDTRRTTRLL